MNIALAYIRVLFFILSVFFMTIYMTSKTTGTVVTNALLGAGIGAIFGVILIAFSHFFRRYNLRSFNIVIIGIFLTKEVANAAITPPYITWMISGFTL